MTRILLLLALLTARPVLAQSGRAVGKPNPRQRSYTKAARRPANNKATFRKELRVNPLDMHVHDPTQFRTAKANRNYTSGKPGRNRVSRVTKRAMNPKIKLGNRG